MPIFHYLCQDGLFEGDILPIIYGLEEGDDWEDEKNWYKANPSLGHTIQIERVREHFQQAKKDPAEETLSIGILEGLSRQIPNIELFVSMYVRKEALLTLILYGFRLIFELRKLS